MLGETEELGEVKNKGDPVGPPLVRDEEGLGVRAALIEFKVVGLVVMEPAPNPYPEVPLGKPLTVGPTKKEEEAAGVRVPPSNPCNPRGLREGDLEEVMEGRAEKDLPGREAVGELVAVAASAGGEGVVEGVTLKVRVGEGVNVPPAPADIVSEELGVERLEGEVFGDWEVERVNEALAV